MRIDIATLFPDMCEAVLSESIIGRARAAGHIEVVCHNIRDYTLNKHNRVDDTPYGGGMGMVMEPGPVYGCWRSIVDAAPAGERIHTVYLSPKGKQFTQKKARELLSYDRVILLCGHYEGVDERILSEIVDEEITVGDYVLTGGELPALIVVDATACCPLPNATKKRASPRGFWNTPTSPALPCFTADGCPACCSRATTRRSPFGGTRRRGASPKSAAPT